MILPTINLNATGDQNQTPCARDASPKCDHVVARIVYDDDPVLAALVALLDTAIWLTGASDLTSDPVTHATWMRLHPTFDAAYAAIEQARLDTLLLCPAAVRAINAAVGAGTFEELTRETAR